MALGLLLSAFLSLPGFSQTPGEAKIGCFSGLVDADTPATLSPCASSDLLNVEANLSGTAIKKRKGFQEDADLTCSTCPVTGSHSFIDSSGNRIDIICQDRYCLKKTNGNAPTNFLTAAASSATRWSWVDAGGIAYGGNNAYDPIVKYDGTTLSRPTGMPKGSILELTQDRLVVADIQSEPNRVHYSSAGALEQFTTGANPEDSYFDDLGAPGDKTRALKHLNGVLYVFKTASITGCELGDQYTSRCAVVSPNIGTTDPGSIVAAGSSLYFRSQDKNYWELSSSGLRQISKAIPNLVKSQSGGLGGGEQSNTQTTQADWEAGTQRPSESFNTATLPGSIFPSSFTFVDFSSVNFLLGTQAGSSPTTRGDVTFAGVTSTYVFRYDANVVPDSDGWTASNDSGITASVSGGSLTVKSDGTGSSSPNSLYRRSLGTITGQSKFLVGRIATQTTGTQGQATVGLYDSSASQFRAKVEIRAHHPSLGTSYIIRPSGTNQTIFSESYTENTYSTYTVIVTTPTGVYFYKDGVFKASSTADLTSVDNAAIQTGGFFSEDVFLFADFVHVSSGVPPASGTSDIVSVATFTSRIFDSGITTPTVASVFLSTYLVSGTTWAFSIRSSSSPNNDLWTAFESVDFNGRPQGYFKRYIQYRTTSTHLNLVEAPGLVRLQMPYASTGTFVTQCIQPNSAITAWGTLSCAESLAGNGSLVYYATSAATCATLPEGDVFSWQTSVTNNATLSIATNTAVRIGWRSLLGSATDQAQIDACTLGWNEGTPVQPSWGVYDSVANSVYWTTTIDNAPYSNRLLKYDRNLDAWFPQSIFAQAPRMVDNSLYFGGSSSGTWNRYGLVDSDNGAGIPAYYKTKDVGSDTPFQEKDFQSVSLLTRNNQSGTLTVDYTYSNAATGSYSVSLSTGAGITYARSNVNLPRKSGQNFLNVKIGNNSTTPFEVLGIGVKWNTLPWKVSGP